MNISTKISETSWSTPTEYFYVRNAHGDIIGLIDKTGTQVVSYNYDSWGKMTPSKAEMDDASDTNKNGITGTLKDTVGGKNPYRYKGYRYDSETELYYLQSRYYNPTWGRFINADAIAGVKGELLSHNIFGYCSNDPINMKDDTGFVRSQVQDDSGSGGGSYSPSSGGQAAGGSISSNSSLKGRFIETVNYGRNRLSNGLQAYPNSAKPNANTSIIKHREVKSPNPVKSKGATGLWDEFLGGGSYTNINPRTGKIDNDRIFSIDGTRSIRFGDHEMKKMGTGKFHYHEEEWKYDPIGDILNYYNTLRRVQ